MGSETFFWLPENICVLFKIIFIVSIHLCFDKQIEQKQSEEKNRFLFYGMIEEYPPFQIYSAKQCDNIIEEQQLFYTQNLFKALHT